MIGQPVTATISHPNGCNLERRAKERRDRPVLILRSALKFLLKLQ